MRGWRELAGLRPSAQSLTFHTCALRQNYRTNQSVSSCVSLFAAVQPRLSVRVGFPDGWGEDNRIVRPRQEMASRPLGRQPDFNDESCAVGNRSSGPDLRPCFKQRPKSGLLGAALASNQLDPENLRMIADVGAVDEWPIPWRRRGRLRLTESDTAFDRDHPQA